MLRQSLAGFVGHQRARRLESLLGGGTIVDYEDVLPPSPWPGRKQTVVLRCIFQQGPLLPDPLGLSDEAAGGDVNEGDILGTPREHVT
jgi:hypothetical protein